MEGTNNRSVRAQPGSHHPSRRASFTLVELLVVVSIIALLISILLPSLKKAREQAKQVKCTADMSGICKGNITYGSEWNGWFLGSPVTTGQLLYPRGGGSWSSAPAAVNVPLDVVQIWDWAGPIAAQTTSLHWNRAERWRTSLITGIFECPSNQFISEPFPAPTAGDGEYEGFGPQRMVSYNTSRALMTLADEEPPGAPLRVARMYYHNQIGGVIYKRPNALGYQPREDRIGNPSEKIFLADGSRYTTDVSDSEPGLLDYAYDWQGSAGGAFSNVAPTAKDEFLNGWPRSSVLPQASRYSYRHPNGPNLGLVAVYFDGHAEWMSEKQSRWPDPWWPKGTKLPLSEINLETRTLVRPYMDTQTSIYTVRR